MLNPDLVAHLLLENGHPWADLLIPTHYPNSNNTPMTGFTEIKHLPSLPGRSVHDSIRYMGASISASNLATRSSLVSGGGSSTSKNRSKGFSPSLKLIENGPKPKKERTVSQAPMLFRGYVIFFGGGRGM